MSAREKQAQLWCPQCKQPAQKDVFLNTGDYYVACDSGSSIEFYDDAKPYKCEKGHRFYLP